MIKYIKYTILLICAGSLACLNSIEYWGNNKLDPKINDDYSGIASPENYKKWGTYNVHDPSVIKAGDVYYMYSTDAIWMKDHSSKPDILKHIGNIQIRKSKDLVHWDFVGWAFKSIPEDAKEHVEKSSGGKLPHGIWAPYITKIKKSYYLYYSVSIFGANTSYIGVATSNNPLGPWEPKGCVVATTTKDSMNAIDPTVIEDQENNKLWMIYGSFFSGIYCLELDPVTGLSKVAGEKGCLVASRADKDNRIIEAPELLYNPQLKKYYLFVSYDALFTHYNVRVGRADKPEGPYFDYFGKNMAEPINHYPILTYAYRFSNHPGWAGTGHCSVLRDDENYFMFHQGRLAPDNQMMVLHVRQLKWTDNGWPVVSPERYAKMPDVKITEKIIKGKWEKVELNEIADSVKLWQGQIPWGGWRYDTTMFNNYQNINLLDDGLVEGLDNCKWNFSDNKLCLINNTDTINLIVFTEWDWEQNIPTIVFTGLNKYGHSLWGKKLNK